MTESQKYEPKALLDENAFLDVPPVDWDNPPPLSEEDLKALESIGPNFLLKIEQMVGEAETREKRRREKKIKLAERDSSPSDPKGS
jgi:hypothetical protein